jgi:mRNA interferase RelE/StbE
VSSEGAAGKCEVIVAPSAEEDIAELDARRQKLILKGLAKLEDNPRPPKSEKLTNYHPPFRRIRIGDYRAIYAFLENERKAVVLVVRHRREAYAGLNNLATLLERALDTN